MAPLPSKKIHWTHASFVVDLKLMVSHTWITGLCVSGETRTRHHPLNIRYYIDPQTEFPHIYGHNVSEEEAEDVVNHPVEDRLGREGSRVAIGITVGGRFLRVIYVPDSEPNSVFVITAYDLRGKPLVAFRRRHRRKYR